MPNDLAGSSVYGPINSDMLFAGEAPIVTGRGVALATITKYQLIAITATGLTPFVDGTHTAAQAAIAAQPAATGNGTPYFKEGYFNEAVIGWPAGFGTTLLRKQKLAGSGIHIDRLLPVGTFS